MSEPTLRRRRRRSDSTDADVFVDRQIETPPPAQEPDNAPVEPEITIPNLTTKLTVVDRIRTELLEDSYHSKLVEPQYWDETHSWSEDLSQSDDYWHFLGKYE